MLLSKFQYLSILFYLYFYGNASYITSIKAASVNVPVRLNGRSQYEGRVEVYHNGQWGSVCDDVFSRNSNACTVICRQLGHSGGQFFPGSQYCPCSDVIWLDDVTCDGNERSLGECRHSFWGVNDCEHSEDAGCACDPPANPPSDVTTDHAHPTAQPPQNLLCDTSRHRIVPISDVTPGVGRVELMSDGGLWEAVCDDEWDDVDAAVFCRCMGYTDERYFGTFWDRALLDMTPPAAIGYDAILCPRSDTNTTTHNLWDCPHRRSTGRCDPATESAGVMCQQLKTRLPLAPPDVSMHCDGVHTDICFNSSSYVMSPQYLSLDPTCTGAVARETTDGVCYSISMDHCKPSDIQVDKSFKQYCYDVRYSAPSAVSVALQTLPVWRRRACCRTAKNGSVSVSGPAPLAAAARVVTADAQPLTFNLTCHHGDAAEASATGGAPLRFPANVSRGEELTCRVSVDTWDERLYLVVPDCSFSAGDTGAAAAMPSFTFLRDKCPTTSELGLKYFTFDGHSWGFRFQVPKFHGYSSLFLTCSSYVCDPALDPKPYCDRSCKTPSNGGGRRRRRRSASGQWWPETLVTGGPLYVSENKGELLLIRMNRAAVNQLLDNTTADANFKIKQTLNKGLLLNQTTPQDTNSADKTKEAPSTPKPNAKLIVETQPSEKATKEIESADVKVTRSQVDSKEQHSTKSTPTTVKRNNAISEKKPTPDTSNDESPPSDLQTPSLSTRAIKITPKTTPTTASKYTSVGEQGVSKRTQNEKPTTQSKDEASTAKVLKYPSITTQTAPKSVTTNYQTIGLYSKSHAATMSNSDKPADELIMSTQLTSENTEDTIKKLSVQEKTVEPKYPKIKVVPYSSSKPTTELLPDKKVSEDEDNRVDNTYDKAKEGKQMPKDQPAIESSSSHLSTSVCLFSVQMLLIVLTYAF